VQWICAGEQSSGWRETTLLERLPSKARVGGRLVTSNSPNSSKEPTLLDRKPVPTARIYCGLLSTALDCCRKSRHFWIIWASWIMSTLKFSTSGVVVIVLLISMAVSLGSFIWSILGAFFGFSVWKYLVLCAIYCYLVTNLFDRYSSCIFIFISFECALWMFSLVLSVFQEDQETVRFKNHKIFG